MNHRKKGTNLNMPTDQREALMRSLATALIVHGEIKTTLPRAKMLRMYVEPIITKGRNNQSISLIFSKLRSNEATKKVTTELAERYAKRPGGYTRIIKAGYRKGDGAPMAYIQLVD
ncbi:MAG: 50S ribosomal protein L17 [Candidatus Comchoanobacterales bacterium]